MKDHLFGVGRGHLPQKADTIARQHGARLVNYTEPNGARRHWFACESKGSPFDTNTARETVAALRRAGLIGGDQ